jgi:pimeloyl-ACP methyl ester carboxylesterase
MPVRLLVGECDRRYVETAQRMLELIPRAELTVCPTAGHTVHLDQPQRFIAWAE